MTIKEFEIQLALGLLTYVVKRKLAVGLNTPKEVLTTLSKDEDWYIRSYISRNPNTPKEILDELAKDKMWVVRRGLKPNDGEK